MSQINKYYCRVKLRVCANSSFSSSSPLPPPMPPLHLSLQFLTLAERVSQKKGGFLDLWNISNNSIYFAWNGKPNRFEGMCGPLTASNFWENVVRINKLGWDWTSPVCNHLQRGAADSSILYLVLSLVYLWEPF